MAVSRFSKARKVPTKVTTKKSSPTTTNFAKGIYTYKPNDAMDYDEIYLAQNARFERIGEYMTRRGIAKLSEPIGKTIATNTYSETYTMKPASDVSLAISSADPIYSINLTVAATNVTDYGVLRVLLLDANNTIVATSCAENLRFTICSEYRLHTSCAKHLRNSSL